MKSNPKKQLRINKMFQKGVAVPKQPDDCDELEEEIEQLKQTVQDKQNELFRIQRNSYRHPAPVLKRKSESFVRPEVIVLSNSVESFNRQMELHTMLTGTEVKSYREDDYCCVVFHMQNDSQHEVKHVVKINLKDGANQISESSLPLGFKLASILEEYSNVMRPECLGGIRRALVAYYDRLEQFNALKKEANIQAQLFKSQDSSHIEISLFMQHQDDEGIGLNVCVMLDYKVFDIRVDKYDLTIKNLDDREVATAVWEQCAPFKKKPLAKAFKEAFVTTVGPFKLIQQSGRPPIGRRACPRTPIERRACPRTTIEQRACPRTPPTPRARAHKRFRPNKHHYNDDTFVPEECSDQGDEDDDGESDD